MRFILTKELNISLSEFDNLEFFETLLILDEYKNWIEEQNKNNSEQNEKYNAEMEKVRSGMPDYNRMTQNLSQSMPKAPTITTPSFQMPSFPSL